MATTGNDAAAGASDAPWRTLQHAADTVAAGDTVTVRAGTYAGFDLRSDGSATNPITFRADPGVVINTPNSRTTDGINLEGADYIVIQGFTVIGVPRAGIRSVVNHHVTVRDNTLDQNGRWGIFAGFSDDLLIENNVASRSIQEHGIYVSNSGDRPTIRHNVIWGNYANGIHMNGDLSEGGDGLISNALVEQNTIYDNGRGGGSGINADGVQNSRFQNNLLYNNHASGISLYRIDGAAGSKNNILVNNTIVQASDGRWALNIQSGSTGNTAFNNILYNNHSLRGSIDISADSLPGFTSDYNVVMDRFTTNGGNSALTLAQWRTATGQDPHSIIATPSALFVNVGPNDYHLSATSPAIDAGTASQAPLVDLDGNARPSGLTWDIGAYERQTSRGAAGTLQFSASAYSVNEGEGSAVITVTRTNGSTGSVTVNYATANGTATADSDYTSTGGTLTLAEGVTSQTFSVPITNDTAVESNETVNLTLSNPTGGAVIGSTSTATLTIVDNDVSSPGRFGYFVATTGNDAADGMFDTPWRTLQHAADTVAPGDTVTVRAGTYAGFDLRTDGTATNPIAFRAETGVVINAPNTRTADGINLEGADYIVIQGFTVTGVPRAGIRSVLNHYVTVRDNTLDQNGRWGIFTGFSDDLLIENNVASRSAQEHGIYVSNSGDRPTIRHNVIWGNFASGIHMNGDLSQGGDGLISNALIEQNTIYENGRGGGSGINADGVQNSRFENNLLYNNHASGISLYRIDGAAGSKNNIMVNNTIVQASDARWALNIQSGSTGNTVLNNILYNNHSFRGSTDISSDSLPGFTSDYNVVMDRLTTNGGTSVLTLAQWRAATGHDVHSIVATPSVLFVNTGSNDYHLSATSPAIDAGTASLVPLVDLDSHTRPSGLTWDIGAFERQTTGGTAGTLQFSASAYSVNEGVSSIMITVTRTNGSTGSVTVNYASANGTATAGSDYTSTSGTLTLADGVTSQTFSVPITTDTVVEGNETANLTLSNPTGGAVLGSLSTATLTIVDTSAGRFKFSSTTYRVGETGGFVVITVKRTGGSVGTVSVNYTISNGTAQAGSDYTAISGTLTFAPGVTRKTIVVRIRDDMLAEGNETVILRLSAPSGGALIGAPRKAILTIVDNDMPATVS